MINLPKLIHKGDLMAESNGFMTTKVFWTIIPLVILMMLGMGSFLYNHTEANANKMELHNRIIYEKLTFVQVEIAKLQTEVSQIRHIIEKFDSKLSKLKK